MWDISHSNCNKWADRKEDRERGRKERREERRRVEETGREGKRMASERGGRVEGDKVCSFRKPTIFTFIKHLFS